MQGKKSTILNTSKNSQGKRDTVIALPPIPDKRYFTIGEAAELCGVKPHVLRFWEQEFAQLKPAKRRGNRRCYQYRDVLRVRQIRKLLYEDGFTIEGARAQLKGNSIEINQSVPSDDIVRKVIADLEIVLQNLKTVDINGA